VDQQAQVMGPREVNPENCQPGLEGFLGRLLSMEANDSIANIRLISEGFPQRGDPGGLG
jgi:hypothetical protein